MQTLDKEEAMYEDHAEQPEPRLWDLIGIGAVALLLVAFLFGAMSPLVSSAGAEDAFAGKRDDDARELVAVEDDDDDDDVNDKASRSGNSRSGDSGSRSRTGTTRGTGKSNSRSNTGQTRSRHTNSRTGTGTTKGTGQSRSRSNSS
jgi:hypothetical protein